MEANQPQVKLENEMNLVEQAKTDDRAFEVLYDFYFTKIYYFVLKRVGHKEIAEDIVSSTFIKVFTGIKNFKPENDYSFCAWLYRIATNNLTDHYRRAGKRIEIDIENMDEPIDEKQDQNIIVANSLDRVMVQKVLSELSARDQEILQLKFFGELSNVEISATLKVSANNVGVLVYRALKKFQTTYQKYV